MDSRRKRVRVFGPGHNGEECWWPDTLGVHAAVAERQKALLSLGYTRGTKGHAPGGELVEAEDRAQSVQVCANRLRVERSAIARDVGCHPRQRHHAACAELVEMHDRGTVKLSVATAFEYDQETARAEQSRRNARFLLEHRIGRVAGPLTLDVSRLDCGDELVDEDTGARLNAIRAAMRPDLPGAAFDRRKALDVHHVSACVYAGLDALVTTDGDDILSKKEQLADLGVVVLDPDEAVALVAARRDGPKATA